jgi:predicted phosphodiesterase
VKIGLLSDAHGNPLGLRTCLERLSRLGVDRVFFLGDAVGYMPGEAECLALLDEAGAECQKGNHEAMLCGELELSDESDAAYRLGEARGRLSEEDRARICAWPEIRELVLGGRRILLVHGSPEDPVSGYVYPDSDLGGFESLPYDAVITANTHRPFAARAGDILVGNVGSSGMPRDSGGLASFGVYDTDGGDFTVYRVAFDVETVTEQISGRVHPSVVECLSRVDPSPFGEVIE